MATRKYQGAFSKMAEAGGYLGADEREIEEKGGWLQREEIMKGGIEQGA